MGVSQPTIPPSLDLKGMVLDNKGMDGCSSGPILYKVVQLQAMRRRSNRRHRTKRNYGWNIRSNALMKRRAPIKGSRRFMGGVERRVRTLQKLLPNVKSMDTDGLFLEAADYILCLEMQVKVMQTMVKTLVFILLQHCDISVFMLLDGLHRYDGLHQGSSYLKHLHFLSAVKAPGDRAPTVDLHDGLLSVAMGVAGQLSIERGRFVTIEEVMV